MNIPNFLCHLSMVVKYVPFKTTKMSFSMWKIGLKRLPVTTWGHVESDDAVLLCVLLNHKISNLLPAWVCQRSVSEYVCMCVRMVKGSSFIKGGAMRSAYYSCSAQAHERGSFTLHNINTNPCLLLLCGRWPVEQSCILYNLFMSSVNSYSAQFYWNLQVEVTQC